MIINIFKHFSLLILLSLVGCNLLTSDPVDQASEIIKTQLKSPSSFKKINGEIIWKGKNAEDMPSYVVSISFESANSFGASLRGCMYVTYSETKDKKVTWNKDYGVRDFSSMLPLCEESTPKKIKQEMAEGLAKINFKILKEETSSSSKSATSAKTLESLELKTEVNDFNGEWKVLWRLSEQTGDVSGYFFKSNSEIDKRIQESCQVKSICIFKFQYDNLDYDQIKDKLPKDFPGASFYGEIKKIIDIKN
jgi:hypothetical protein